MEIQLQVIVLGAIPSSSDACSELSVGEIISTQLEMCGHCSYQL